jgi:PKD domain
MNTANELRTRSNFPRKSHPIHRLCPARAVVTQAVTLLCVFFSIVAGIGSVAGAQSLGFVVNSSDGTVTVFGNATNSLEGETNTTDATLQKVTFPTQAGQSAPSLVATAVAPAAGSNTPPARLVYVTDQQNNELWAFDISTISQGNAAAKPVSIASGSCTPPLFNQPGAIVIATPGSSVFGYVVNQGNGTVSIVDLAAASCVAQTAALGTITGMAASPDMNEVFVITATVGSPALWVIDTTATPQIAAQITLNATATAPINLSDPVSIAVQNDAAACYFIAIGDKGNSTLFLLAVGPSGDADPNCPDSVTPILAQLVQAVALTGSNPVGVVSTFAPMPSGADGQSVYAGSAYVADASNNEIWEIDCSTPPSTYSCSVSENGPSTLTNGATPTTIGISLPQTISSDAAVERLAVGDTTYQYVYVAGTVVSPAGSVFEYSDVGVNDGSLLSLTPSAVTLGNGPQGLIFSGADPNDPPVTWFITTSGAAAPFQGPIWVMPVTGELTVLGSTIANLSSPIPALSLNFGTAAGNGLLASTPIFCAPFGSNAGGITDCPGSSPAFGVNAVGGSSSTTSGGQAGSLNFPASTVFTVTLEACSEATGCPPSPSPIDTLLTQQVYAGAVCTLNVSAAPPLQNTSLQDIAIGQTLNASINCFAPASGTPPAGDGIAATITWAPGVTGTVSCTSTTCPPPTTSANGYAYENPTLSFPTNSYSAAKTYTVSVQGTDTSENNIPIFFTGTSASQSITVNGPGITVSPAGTASQPVPVQLLGTEGFAGVASYALSTPTVTWTLTSGGSVCSPACGTISNATVSQIFSIIEGAVVPTLNYNISATYNAPAAVFSGAITLTVSGNGVSAQAFIATTTSTTTPPPSCSFSTPPTTGQTGVLVTVTLACSAPANDGLSVTVDFSDGNPSTMTGTAGSNGTTTLTFTHAYANPGIYTVSITSIADTTSGLFGTPPVAVPINVYLTPTVTPVQSSVELAPGQSATFAVNFSSGLSDANVTFSNFACQHLPSGASCTFSPTSITLDANGNSTNTLQVTVTLGASTSSRVVAPHTPQQILLVASLWGVPLFGLVFLGAGSRGKGRERRRLVWCGVLLILVLMWIPACSSVTQSNLACSSCATPGNYPVTVTGSSVNPELQATTVFTLEVQP